MKNAYALFVFFFIYQFATAQYSIENCQTNFAPTGLNGKTIELADGESVKFNLDEKDTLRLKVNWTDIQEGSPGYFTTHPDSENKIELPQSFSLKRSENKYSFSPTYMEYPEFEIAPEGIEIHCQDTIRIVSGEKSSAPSGNNSVQAFFPKNFKEKIKNCIENNAPCSFDMLEDCKNSRWAVRFDMATNTVHYFKKKRDRAADGYYWKERNKISPYVGSELYFDVVNDNPFRDSLNIKYNYKSLFQEGQAEFLSFIEQSKPGQDQTDEESETKVQTIQSEELNQSAKDLLSELIQYESYIRSLSSLNYECIQAELATLDSNIVQAFGAEPFSKGWEAYGKDYAEYIDEADREEWLKNTTAIGVFYAKFRSAAVNRSKSIQIKNDDLLIFSVEDQDENVVFTERKLSTSWGFKIDFSTGLFASSLGDQIFSLDSVSTPGTTSIVEKDGEEWNLRFGTLAHFYTRTGGMVDPAIHFGFLVDSDLDTQLAIGGSLLLGKPDRLALTGGVAFGKVDRLRSDLEGQRDDYLGEVSATLTEERWDHGFYLGITFNFAQAGGGKE